MYRLPHTVPVVALLLGGCVAVPCANNPGMTCYAPVQAQPVAVAPAYPYPPPGPAYVGPDGLTYEGGYPVGVIEGEQVPLVFDPGLGGWGYYDRLHHWRGAPPEMRERLERFHPGGRGLPPSGEFHRGPGRPEPGGGPPRPPGPPQQHAGGLPLRPAAAPAPRRPPPAEHRCPPDRARC